MNVNLLDDFKKGLIQNRLDKMRLRKDAISWLNLQKHFNNEFRSLHSQTKSNEQPTRSIRHPYYKLKDGRNLFEIPLKEYKFCYEVFDINLKEKDRINFLNLAALPNLTIVNIIFSSVYFERTQITNSNERQLDDIDNKAETRDIPLLLTQHTKSDFYYLSELNLSFNKLNDTCLNFISSLPNLSSLVLIGNFITKDLPYLGNLPSLEFLDLTSNRIESSFVNLNLIMKNETFKFPDFDLDLQSAEEFEEWQKFLKTDIRQFWLNLARVPKLKVLKLAYNKIHFFDINPFDVLTIKSNEAKSPNEASKERSNQFSARAFNGFQNLVELDLSHNLIEEEIGILLVMNLRRLETLNIVNNPICFDKPAFGNIEYEIFKNSKIQILSSEKTLRPYLVKQIKIPSVARFNKHVREKVQESKEKRERLIKESEIYFNLDAKDRIVIEHASPEIGTRDDYLDLMPRKDNLFLTNANAEVKQNFELRQRRRDVNEETKYFDFLLLAKDCFGNGIHYNKSKNINVAYSELRRVLKRNSDRENEAIEPNYMKDIKSRIGTHNGGPLEGLLGD